MTLKKKWFDMIASGVKTEEYRTIKPYWSRRLLNNSFDVVLFRNGYKKDSPEVLVEFKELCTGLGIIEWGAPAMKRVYILRLGSIIIPNRTTSTA